MTEPSGRNEYSVEPIVNEGGLPDPFALPEGGRLRNREEWPRRAAAWRDLILDMEYGWMPPAPEAIEVETLAHSAVRRWPGTPRLWTYRITCRGGRRDISFCVRILFPSADGPFPAVVNGDGCWSYVSEDVTQRVLGSGCALITFNHCLPAAIAPRPVLLTYALDDRRSNPEGMVQCAWAAGEVYRFLGSPDHLAFHLRPGTHTHATEDWDVLLDFIGWKWRGMQPTAPCNTHPYAHLDPI